jgi:hypothetical protein
MVPGPGDLVLGLVSLFYIVLFIVYCFHCLGYPLWKLVGPGQLGGF